MAQDPVLLWLWHRPADEAPSSLGRELPYAPVVALKIKKKRERERRKILFSITLQRRIDYSVTVCISKLENYNMPRNVI